MYGISNIKDVIYDLLPQHVEAEDRAASKRGDSLSLSYFVYLLIQHFYFLNLSISNHEHTFTSQLVDLLIYPTHTFTFVVRLFAFKITHLSFQAFIHLFR